MRHPLIPVFVLIAAASIMACREKPRPAEQPPTAEATALPGLTPLTSRGAGSAEAPATNAPHGEMGSPHEDLPAGHPPVGNMAGAPHAGADAAASGRVAGTVEVAPARKGDVKGGAVFVIARSAASHQVVAVRREETGPFPLKFELTAADTMMAGVAFEGPFDVTARWSQQGDAMPAAGDIEGMAKGVALNAANVKIVLSDVRK
jgi:cytochrome c-type biogenesis protein CcmH